jgi:hypothetical protein
MDRDAQQTLSTMRAKHDHRIKALKQSHVEQFDAFRRVNAALMAPTVRHLGSGMYVSILGGGGGSGVASPAAAVASPAALGGSARSPGSPSPSPSPLALTTVDPYLPAPRARRERKVKAILQSPEIYLIKDCDSVSGSSTAFVFRLSDSVINYFDSVAKRKADLHLFEIYALKCDLDTKVRPSP